MLLWLLFLLLLRRGRVRVLAQIVTVGVGVGRQVFVAHGVGCCAGGIGRRAAARGVGVRRRLGGSPAAALEEGELGARGLLGVGGRVVEGGRDRHGLAVVFVLLLLLRRRLVLLLLLRRRLVLLVVWVRRGRWGGPLLRVRLVLGWVLALRCRLVLRLVLTLWRRLVLRLEVLLVLLRRRGHV